LLLGYGSDFTTDDTFWDKAEEIPDGYIIQRELVKAMNGKPFFYNDGITGKPVRCEATPWDVFFYYYQLWEDFHVLRVLPHGQGTLAERRWLLDLLKIFEKVFAQVENLKDEWLARKYKNG
jgi:hypothetical protein